MTDFVDNLSDAELRTKLAEYGFPVVPITHTTRKVMAKKLKMLIENKTKINSESRRSLAKYSSEEESDEDVKTKKDKNRRATMGTAMLPPVASKSRRSLRRIDNSTNDDAERSTIVTETKSRRTTRIIQPVIEADSENYSDSEPEIVEEYVNVKTAPQTRAQSTYTSDLAKGAVSSSSSSYGGVSSYLTARSPLGQSATNQMSKNVATTSYTSPSRYGNVQESSADDSYEKLNQIRSRLSLNTNYDRPFERRTIGLSGEGDASGDTPYLSNFSRRLSQLSNANSSKTDYNYKNDIIKEHDANGSSYNRSYLSRMRNRDYSQDFKSSQEKNVSKNNFVSFTLVSIACAFFAAIMMFYWGIKSDQPALADTSGYVIPLCYDSVSSRPGVDCVLKSDETDALNLQKVLLPELKKRAVHHRCIDRHFKPFMNDNEIINYVATNYVLKDPYEIQKAINNLQVLILKNPDWGMSVVPLENEWSSNGAVEDVEQLLEIRLQNNLALLVPNPDLPLKCVIYYKATATLQSLLFIGLGFLFLYLVQRAYKYLVQLQKSKNDEVFAMVEKIIDILQVNATDSPDNYLAVNHVRDVLIPPQDRKRLNGVWNKAVKFLQENESRVRTEFQIVSGEEFHVWRWLGNPNLNATNSPRSKSWQGQAFETQVGSVNSLPCSPTPCLKIRGMFDERENNLSTVREAVLGKCAHKCKILHCEADITSGCVYLKCASQAEAAIAYRNLHGWWYDGHLVTVKYLRLERYMQRFPNSPAKGPPFLSATCKTISKD